MDIWDFIDSVNQSSPCTVIKELPEFYEIATEPHPAKQVQIEAAVNVDNGAAICLDSSVNSSSKRSDTR